MNATIIPTLRYEKAKEAIEWLCLAFGFQTHLVVPGDGDTIAHAQLTLGNAMIMLGSTAEDEYGNWVKSPLNFAGVNTQAPYIILEEIDQHYQKAIEAGAEILIEIKDEDYGGRVYSCRDPEGHIWNFGSYDPWEE